MKKHVNHLTIHRETLLRLSARESSQAAGGAPIGTIPTAVCSAHSWCPCEVSNGCPPSLPCLGGTLTCVATQ